jgi:hypothetical protein
MVTVAICGVMVALAANALSSARKVSRVAGQARYILQRLQSVRTAAVGQGAAQGYYFGPNGPGAAGADANQGFVFYKLDPASTVVSYVAPPLPNADRPDVFRDALPTSGTESLVVVTGGTVAQPAPFQIGFDMNGQVTLTPPDAFPYCIKITDFTDPSIVRYVILFNDGTAKVQGNETWCP